MKKQLIALSGAGVALILVGCASAPMSQGGDEFKTMMKNSFSARGIAKLDRLDQDAGQAACSSDKVPSPEVAKRIEAEALASIKWPTGGQYFDNFKEGEKLAQGGRGMTWSDKSTDPKQNGGSCYNCHQISKQELSYGNIGPSLYNYGKIRGVKDLNDPAVAPIIQYTWSKIWNSKAYAACSNMPRFGHSGLLNEDQIRDLMALLLDPKSPVNQ
jgi:sulfur-oxidizing protein SoxX